MADAGFIVQQFEKLVGARANWESHWQEIGELIWPDTADFTNPNRVRGEKRMQNVFDATAALALDRFAAAMSSLLTPRAQKWHHLKASAEELNEDPEVKEWFDAVTIKLFSMRERPKTNYYGSIHEGYKSDGAYGTSCLWLEESKDELGYVFRSDPLAQVYIATDANGTVDTAYRKYKLTAHAANKRWKDNPFLPRQILEAKDPWQEFDFVLCVTPNPEFEEGRMDDRGKPFTAVEVSLTEKVILEQGGFWEFPYIIGRYTRNAGEDYGRSPAMIVLPDIKTLQEQEKTFLRAGHRAVAPPLLLTHDGVLGAGGSRAPRIVPDGLNFGGLNERGEPMIKPLITGARLDLTEGMMEQKRSVINDAFLVTLFRILVDEPRVMTATEILERSQEKGQLLAPLVGRQQSEKLGPQIVREINILQRQGQLPPLPPALVEARGEYEIEYDSPATRFQRMEEISGLSRTMEAWGPIIQNNPALLDLSFNAEEGIRDTAGLLGVPGKWLRTAEEQKAMKQQMVEAQQEAKEQAQLPEQARAAKDGVAALQGAQELTA